MRGEPFRHRDLFGGRGEVRVWSLLRAVPPPFDCLLDCELDPDGNVGVHVQERCAEIVVVTAGHGEARVQGKVTALAPGVAVAVPLGHTLQLSNASAAEPLRYLIVKAQ